MKTARTLLLAAVAGLTLSFLGCDRDAVRDSVTASQEGSWQASFRVSNGDLTETELARAGWVRVEAWRGDTLLVHGEAAFSERKLTLTIPSPGAVTIKLIGYDASSKETVMWTGSGTVADGVAKPGTGVVTLVAGPGLASKHYDSALTSLAIGDGLLAPAFAPAVRGYVDTVNSSVGVTTITASTTDPKGCVVYSVNGGAYGSANSVTLAAETVTTVKVKSMNEAGDSLVYTVRIYRKPAVVSATASDSTLAALSTVPGAFVGSFGREITNYVDSVPAATQAVTVAAVANVEADVQSITYNGATDNGVTLNATGNTLITVVVKNRNGNTHTYTITVVKKPTVVPTYALAVTAPANGSIALDPATGPYDSGKTVTVTATASTGYSFSGWTGACAGTATATCTVLMTGGKTLGATFAAIPKGTFSLTLTASTNGSISLNPAAGPYDSGTIVTATATANSGYSFNGWTGACAGAATTCTVLMTESKTLGATFTAIPKPTYNLTLTASTNGSISLNPASGPYDSGTTVTATATANSGYSFSGWTGACAGTGACTVSMTGSKVLGATFTAIPKPTYGLTVTTPTNGSISLNPASGPYDSGTTVTATATANSGYSFSGWTGACAGTVTTTCTVLMTGNKTLGAAFVAVKKTYTLAVNPTTNGTVVLNSSAASYDSGVTVTATATAQVGYTFVGWAGACTGTATTCTILMTGNKALVATFTDHGIPWMSGISYDSVADAAGRKYRTVKIGSQTWMAENLNYTGSASSLGTCYGGVADSCVKYGRLYTWAEVMNGATSTSLSPSGVPGICPVGWHVPSDTEWMVLQAATGDSDVTDGKMLKSTSGWEIYNGVSGNGTDKFGFRALPAGSKYTSTSFGLAGKWGYWWSTTQSDAANVWCFQAAYNYAYLGMFYMNKTNGFPLRCVKN